MAHRYELKHIDAFLVLAETCHFGRAAERLHVSQSALTRLIQQLEAALGVRLFNRHSRRVALSSFGIVLHEEAQRLADQAERLEEKIELAVEGRAGRLVVAYIDLALGGILPEALQRYRHEFPEVEIELVRMATDLQREKLLAGDIDVGFILGRFRASSVRSKIVERQSYVALVPTRHPFALRPEIDVGDLLNQPLVLGSLPDWSAFRRRVLEEAARRAIRPRIVQETLTGEGILALVAAGVGVSIYSQSHLGLARSGVAVRPLIGMSGDVDLHLCWGTANRGPTATRFVSEVLEVASGSAS